MSFGRPRDGETMSSKRRHGPKWRKIDLLMIGTVVMCKILLLVGLTTGRCPIKYTCQKLKRVSTHDVIEKPFLKDVPRQVVLLGYARSGSSYLGRFLGGHQTAFYSYEPLDALYVALYGTREGWNCHSDIVYYSNGTERIPGQREIQEVSRYVSNLLNCRTDSFYPEIWLHGFWQKYSKYHASLSSYVRCLERRHVNRGDFLRCQDHLSNHCVKQLDWDSLRANDRCPVGVLNKRGQSSSSRHEQYSACVADLESASAHCRKYFQMSCQRSSFRLTKTIRMTMESVEELIKDNPNLRVVHLVRDPRAVVYSRARFDPSVHGLYAGSPMNPVKEATAYCSIVRRDIVRRKQLEKAYPGVLMEVRHEEFTSNPEVVAKRICDFVGLEFDEERRSWLNRTMTSWRRQSSDWKLHLPRHVIRTIDRVCDGVYQFISYKQATMDS